MPAIGRRAFLAGSGGAALLATRARADAGFLEGEQLTIICASSAGTGNDATARLFAEHLAPRLPRTRISVENIDKAAGQVAEKTLWEAAPDGRTIAFLRSNAFFRALQDAQDDSFGLQDFVWLGGLSQECRVLVATAASGVADFAGLLARDRAFTLPVDSITSTRYIVALLVNAMLGTWLLPVAGYKGSANEMAAIAGEVDGVFGTYQTALPVLDSASGRVLLRIGQGYVPPPYDAAPQLADLPVKPADRWVLPLLEAEAGLGRIVAAPPGLPLPERAALRDLVAAVGNDPAFQAGATAIGLDVQVTPGDALAAQIAAIPRPDAETVARFQALTACGLARAKTGSAC